jgi:hypothetical protein
VLAFKSTKLQGLKVVEPSDVSVNFINEQLQWAFHDKVVKIFLGEFVPFDKVFVHQPGSLSADQMGDDF